MSGFLKFVSITIFLFCLVICLDYLAMNISPWLYVILTLIFCVVLALGVTGMRYQMFVKSFIRASIQEQKIALTFDDGPCSNTNKVLDLLKEYSAKATFFCVGKNVEKHPEILKRIELEGHVIGNHTYNHGYFIDFIGKKKMIYEISKAEDAIHNLTGKKTRLFRPPYGITNLPISKAIAETGYNVVGWNIRTLDTVRTINDKLIDRILHKISPGAVLLLHDRVEKNLSLLERILIFAHEHDYECVGVNELFKIKPYE